MKKNLACYPTRFGNMVHDRRDQCIGQSLKVYGEWAPGEIAVLNSIIEPGNCVLDIGANIGFHSVFFSRKVGETGTVISFEPVDTNYEILTLNQQMNNLDNLTLYKALVSSSSKIVRSPNFQLNQQNLGATSFLGEEETNAPVTPLLQLSIDDLELNKCALIKIDVEGMEKDVFEGANNTLKRLQPILFFEQNSENNFLVIQDTLLRLGYKCFWSVTKAFPKFNIRKNSQDIFAGNTETNILAIPDNMVEKFGFLQHLAGVDAKTYNRPDLSELPDQYYVQSHVLTQVDLQWAHFLSSFFRA